MEKKIELAIVLTVFAMIAVIAVPSVSAGYPANATYLVPEDSSGEYCEDNTFVEVRINASVITHTAQMDIYFDHDCVNITDVDFTGSAWLPMAPPGWTHSGDHIRLIGTNFAGASAGDNLFATLRLHCVREPDCLSDLEFHDVIVAYMYPDVTPINITPYNGTFTCRDGEEPDLVVDKSVELVDGTFIVSYTVTNNGPGPAGVSTTCKYIDGVLMDTMTCPALGPGESYSDAFPAEDCPSGQTITVTVCADNDDVVDESNENNNCVDNTVVCPEDKLMEGDVTNINECVSLKDSTSIMFYLVDKETLTPDQQECADTNDDNTVTLKDSTFIQFWLVDPDNHLLWDPQKDDHMQKPVPCNDY